LPLQSTTRFTLSSGAIASTSGMTYWKALPGPKSARLLTAILWRSSDFGVISTSGLR
jgi:hypothetical protein